MKKCIKCGVEKPLNLFRKKLDGKYGVGAQCKSCINAAQTRPKKPKRTKEETKNLYKSRAFFKKYGIHRSDFDLLRAKQDNKCAICKGNLENNKKSHMDHCHASGKLRGVLCTKCNVGLGMFQDNMENLKSAVKYLKKYSVDSVKK